MKNLKRIIMFSTLAIAISIGESLGSSTASASTAVKPKQQETKAVKEDIVQVLGLSSDEELYNALYDGKTMADIASESGVDLDQAIRLQVAELTAQLNQRFAQGSITWEQYAAQKAELTEIVTRSVHGI
ncbi:hypothetical protein OIN60_21555 [Paenibacillus sp. P96]|uniref:Uncharacterized protein n=1 Tax=Paenibacillus zeirhizosphaerae TaxID=2987519 RepID=A0ABT9FX44_9BACL|nr:hypothetical protein [Paenibacillus sp. P96]MDP4099306.1 hypothetical protein [Paenibacillus sp. P96]